LRNVDVHDVAERVLREVGDPDADAVRALVARPLVFLRVPQVLGNSIGFSLGLVLGRDVPWPVTTS
jgi:hypothetical protein